MFSYNYKIRVRYGETDQMGYVYYGNYASYYETARVESLRSLGFVYRELEENGIMLPVLENHSYFKGPARYDELLTIRTSIPEIPGVKIVFNYEIFNEEDKLINTGKTVLAFIDMSSGKPVRPPNHIVNLLSPYYQD